MQMIPLSRIAAALADTGRLRAVAYLSDGELCACQLAAALRLSPSTISRHMAALEGAGLVAARKEGRRVYFRRAGRGAPAAVRDVLRWVDAHAGEAEIPAADRRRLATIRRRGPDGCCGPQRRGDAR